MSVHPKLFVFNFPPVPHAYSVCPFAIKLESFLRINNIPYEKVYSSQMSSKKQMPYVRFGDPDTGEELPDSNSIISWLQTERTVSDHSLSPAQRAISHAITRMLEEHTTQIGFYYRYGLEMQSFFDALDIHDRFGNREMTDRWMKFQPEHTKNKTKMRGLTKHSDEELWNFSNDDIQALSDLLGDGKYFFGEMPTLADCAVFGHLSQFMWIPIDFPQQKYLKEQCQNLVDFMETFRTEHWSDWDKCCEKRPNLQFTPKASNEKQE